MDQLPFASCRLISLDTCSTRLGNKINKADTKVKYRPADIKSRYESRAGAAWIIVVLKIALRTCPSSVRMSSFSGPSRLVSGHLPGVKYISENPFNTCHLPQFSPVGSNLVTAASHVAQL